MKEGLILSGCCWALHPGGFILPGFILEKGKEGQQTFGMQRLCFDSKVILVQSALGHLQEHFSLRSCPALLEQGEGHNSRPSITWDEGKPFGLPEPLKETTWTAPGPACLSSAQTVSAAWTRFIWQILQHSLESNSSQNSKRLEHSSAFPLLLPTALEGGPEVSLWSGHSSCSC